MKLALIATALVALLLCGCCGGSNDWQNSSGPKRVVTLYANDGSVIKRWAPDRGYASFNEGWAFFRVNGVVVKVTGTMISEAQ